MRKYLYIVYNKRSCVTGRALFEKLKEIGIDGYRIRRSINNNPRRPASAIIRWGESQVDRINTDIDINTSEAVNNAADKMIMAEKLIDAPDVTFPPCSRSTPVDELRDDQGKFFVRNQYDHIRYTANVSATDRYVVKNIDKAREFRVHVFEEKVIGVYEKVPHADSDGMIRKDDNSDFKRLDMADRDVRHAIPGVRPQAKAAVKALGLVYGGVDVAIGRDGTVYVLEVNSAPALNEPNIDRWAILFKNYIERGV